MSNGIWRARRGARVRVLTTDYMNVTHPDAVTRLIDLGRTGLESATQGVIQVRVFRDPTTSFHPKAYLFSSTASSTGRAFVGSNNLSRSGIDTGIEWSLETNELSSLLAAFERLWTDVRSETVDDVWLNAYRARVGPTTL